MQLFYENIHKKETYVVALKKAKVEMIKNNVSPSIWASFILHGAED
jgi:CHAT domain-containing protein